MSEACPKSNEQQSPINIKDTVYAELGPDRLSIDWTEDVHGDIELGDHGWKVVFASDSRQSIKLAKKRFYLREFHFHHPSEHWVNGKQYSMEMHLVHRSVDDDSIAVIGVFLELGEASGKQKILVSKVSENPVDGSDGVIETDASTNPRDYLPSDIEAYYRYEGSLTTSPYSENVSWVVMRDPRYVSQDELKLLLSLFKSEARFPLPTNRRFVLRTFDPPPPPKSPKKKK